MSINFYQQQSVSIGYRNYRHVIFWKKGWMIATHIMAVEHIWTVTRAQEELLLTSQGKNSEKIPSKGNWRLGPDHRSNYRLRTSSKTPKSWPIIFVYHGTTLQEELSKWTFFADQSRLLNDVKQIIRDVGDKQNSQHGKPLPLIKDMKKLFQGLHFEDKMLLKRADRS